MASYEQVVPCTWKITDTDSSAARAKVLCIHPLKFRRPLHDVWVDVFVLKIPLNRHIWWQWKKDGLNILKCCPWPRGHPLRFPTSEFCFQTSVSSHTSDFQLESSHLWAEFESVNSSPVSGSSFANTACDTKADLNPVSDLRFQSIYNNLLIDCLTDNVFIMLIYERPTVFLDGASWVAS